MPPTAMVPVAKPPSYLWRSSSGSAARPNVAVVATDDPTLARPPVPQVHRAVDGAGENPRTVGADHPR